MEWNDEEFYCEPEPTEYEVLLDSLKQIAKESVKQEILDELNQLREENAQLQEVKDNWNKMLWEHRNVLNDLNTAKRDLESKVRRERLQELMKDREVILYSATTSYVKGPKCDKCDEHRRLVFSSPRGKQHHEPCECADSRVVYVPDEHLLNEFRKNRDGNAVIAWYARYRDKDEDGYKFTNAVEKVYNGEPFDSFANHYGVYFRTIEECQSYCDWLNDKHGGTSC